MAEAAKRDIHSFFIDKSIVRRIVAETNARMGFVPDRTATGEQAQAMTEALGIRPEDNLGSRGIIAARYGEDKA